MKSLKVARSFFLLFLLIGIFVVGLKSRANAENLLPPSDIRLSGLERQASVNSPLGRIELRWPRAAELILGKTPEKASLEAATSIAKALRQSSLPQALKLASHNWKIIFISSNISGSQVPKSLIDNCHPGWMTPPANIYIVSERVAGDCHNQGRYAKQTIDSQLARVLVHEMAHALELKLSNRLPLDRARSEGFASWFESFAAKTSSELSSTQIIAEQKYLARQKLSSGTIAFDGQAVDYALAASLFHLYLQNNVLSDLTRLYDIIEKNQLSLVEAIKKINQWNDKQLNDQLLKYVSN